MKVYVITEDVGYGNGEVVRAVRLDKESVTAWLFANDCGDTSCQKRHDRWCSYDEIADIFAPTGWPGGTVDHEEVMRRHRLYADWGKQFCDKGMGSFDIEEFDTDE